MVSDPDLTVACLDLLVLLGEPTDCLLLPSGDLTFPLCRPPPVAFGGEVNPVFALPAPVLTAFVP